MERSKGDGLKRKMEQGGDSGENSTSSSSMDTDQRKRAKLCDQPEPGDLIEIFHDGYKDWALYEGDRFVVHLELPSSCLWTLRFYENMRCNVLVKRELLEDVVGGCSWQINNHLDHKCPPQPVERILSAAQEKVGQMMAFCAWFNNCEHFVDSLRYGLVPRQQFYEYAKPGDMINISRGSHWGLYEGQNYVIHLVPKGGTSDSSSKDPDQSSRVVVKRELLKDVAGDTPYWVDNCLDYKHIPWPSSKILRVAQEKIGQEMEYTDEGLRGDDFINYLRYGMAGNVSFREELKPGDILEHSDSDNEWWSIYEGDGYVIHLEERAKKTQTGCSCPKYMVKRGLLNHMVTCNYLKTMVNWDQLKDLVKWDLLKDVIKWDLLKDVVKWDFLKDVVKWDLLKDMVKWDLLKDVVKWDFLEDVVKWDLLMNVVNWDLLKYMLKSKLLKYVVNWNFLKHVIKLDLLKDVVKWDLLRDAVKWDLLKDMIKWDLLKDMVKWDLLKNVAKSDLLHNLVNWDLLKDMVKWDLLKDVVKWDLLKDVVKLNLLKDVVNWNVLKEVVKWSDMELEINEHRYRVNNHLDDQCPPRPVDMILSAAKEKVGEEIKCMTRSCISEHFATSLRYGLAPTEQFHEDTKPGDLVEIFCAPHHHWAISVGDGHVIHLALPGDTPDILSKFPAHRHMAVVKHELLKDVAGDCPYWVNNLFDHKFTPLPVDEILRAAEKRIGEEMESSDGIKDSEHFVSSLRYGVAITEQVHQQPKPGDLIEIYNSGDTRWAVCEEDGYVIHVDFTDSTKVRFEVKRTLLKDVLGGSPYRINNYLDNRCPPQSVYKILSTAKAKMDISFSHNWRNKQEDFVTSLRYGVVRIDPFQDKPKPEEVIEIFHPNEKHWAIYEGDGYIIHLFRISDKTTATSSSIRAVVKRELLKDVVGDGYYESNILYQDDFVFSQRGNIIPAATKMIGEEMEFSVWNSSNEHFVNYLMFGIIYDEPFCEEPKPGDIIEIADNSRHHWAIYEGAGYVIHLAPPSDKTDVDSSSQHPDQSLKAVVKREPLKDVVGASDYRVENHFDNKYSIQPVMKILSVAKEKIGEEVEYTAQGSSAEHFANYLRYGLCYDEQFCKEPSVGDLIECFSSFNQWAIYEGNGHIIHLATTVQVSNGRKSKVAKRKLLKKVVGTDGYRINNYLDHKHTPQPVSRILSAAQEKIGKKMKYNYGDWKNKQFFTKLRYGDITNQ